MYKRQTERAKEFAEEFSDRYVNADTATRKKALVDYVLPRNIDALRRDLSRYRIDYDEWFRESVLHNDGEQMCIRDRPKGDAGGCPAVCTGAP